MKALFGRVDGQDIIKYTLGNNNKMQVTILNYGGLINGIFVPDKNGISRNVVLGFDSIEGYLNSPSVYFGKLIGRYANRINGSTFKLNGETYKLTANNGVNCLHGGIKGFDKYIWNSEETTDGVRFRFRSSDGDQGFPGNLQVEVNYVLEEENNLRIIYRAMTDKPTPVNLTNHVYLNPGGVDEKTILDQELMINAEYYTEIDQELIPTGNILPVSHSPFDFTIPRKISENLSKVRGGYDHNWILNGSGLKPAATLHSKISGIFIEIHTTEPGIQFYSGNFLDGSFTGHDGKKYIKYAGLCLETQHFPDSPNHPEFPSAILNPKEIYKSETVYKFGIK